MSDPELEKILQRKMRELRSEDKKQSSLQKVHTLTAKNFSTFVESDTPTLVDFWAEWCAPCRFMHPIFERLASKYGDKIRFGRLNVDENGEIAARYHVFSIPTFMIFKAGKVIDQIVGAVGEKGLEKAIIKCVTE